MVSSRLGHPPTAQARDDGANMSLSAVFLFMLLLLRLPLGCRNCCLSHLSRVFLRTSSVTSSPLTLKSRCDRCMSSQHTSCCFAGSCA
ncbi:unnamed protein product [Pylaiella littoralis]